MGSGQAYRNAEKLEDIMPEHELIAWGKLKKDTLATMRNDGRLPYSFMDQHHRFYFVADILGLLKSNRVDKHDSGQR